MADQTTFSARYDDPNFTVLHQQIMPGTVQLAGSVTSFAHFRCRNKCLVRSVNFRLQSAASGVAGSICAVRCRNTPSNSSVQTIKSYSLVSATSAGSMGTITLDSLNTLASISDYIACQVKTNAKGKWEIIYEFQLLPPSMTMIGS